MGCRSNGSSEYWAVGIKTRTPLPVPVDQSSSHTTQIQNVSLYIALQENENSYLELKEFQFSQCLGNKIIHCPFLLPRIQATTYTCSCALFFINKEQIKSFSPAAKWHILTERGIEGYTMFYWLLGIS